MTAPPVPYFGGKGRLAADIAALFCDHVHYVEPYCGGLSVLLAKRPSAMETVNDLDGDLVVFWKMLRDRPRELARLCALTPHSRAEHEQAFDRPADLTDLERARRVWSQLVQGRAGVLRRTGWRHFVDPGGSSTGMPGYLRGYVDRLAPAAERLARVSLECRPALDLIDRYGRSPEVLLYVDPPYLGSARTWGANYRHEMRADLEHRELADALNACKAAVVLSGYPSPLYDQLYDGWHRTTFSATTGQGGASGERTEVVWSNRLPQPTLFSDHESGAPC